MQKIQDIRHRRCTILFIRAPQRGAVKTRLERKLDPDTVLQLYKAFVRDVVCTAKTRSEKIRIGFFPSDQKASVMDWLGGGADYFPQTGADLGRRMETAFRAAFHEGFAHAVLIGSDIPDLPGSVLTEAFSALENGKPVIGPAKDGGYYLIGFSRDTFAPAVFAGMVWSRSDVFERTRAAFERAGRLPHVLTEWRDVDDYADLKALADRCRAAPASARHTRRRLKEMGLV